MAWRWAKASCFEALTWLTGYEWAYNNKSETIVTDEGVVDKYDASKISEGVDLNDNRQITELMQSQGY